MSDMLVPYPWHLNPWQHFSSMQDQNKLSHAYLISGEKGVGKHRFLEVVSKRLMCEKPAEIACGECKSCQLFESKTHPDFVSVEVDEKSKNIKIDQIRSVVDFVSKTPQLNGRKVVVINPAESMNINASNALLKCLEEPSGDTVILLVSHAPHRLLPTIKSRCQTILLDKPSEQQGKTWLSTFIKNPEELDKIYELASGNPLLALEYYEADILSFYQDCVKSLLGLTNLETNPVNIVENVLKKDPLQWLLVNEKILWKLIKLANELEDKDLDSFKPYYTRPDFKPRAFRFLEELQYSIKEFMGTTNPNPQLLLESIVIRWQALLR